MRKFDIQILEVRDFFYIFRNWLLGLVGDGSFSTFVLETITPIALPVSSFVSLSHDSPLFLEDGLDTTKRKNSRKKRTQSSELHKGLT